MNARASPLREDDAKLLDYPLQDFSVICCKIAELIAKLLNNYHIIHCKTSELFFSKLLNYPLQRFLIVN